MADLSMLDLANPLVAAAKKYIDAVEPMSTDELDDWYEERVGYRLSVDDPSIVGTLKHNADVAEMMCLHEHGEGETYDALVYVLVQIGWRHRG